MKARYIRVSTGNQNTERQQQKNHPDEKLYIDIVSGAIPFKDREQGKRMIQDIVYHTMKKDLCIRGLKIKLKNDRSAFIKP